MNFLDYQQALFIAFNPILLLLLALWVALGIMAALSDTVQDAAHYVRDKFKGR